MLDSNIEKILSSEELKNSTQIEVPEINKQLASINSDEISNVNPEAEVRLVVRFSLEEHIVYKGKVERVQQLDSETLSRVVSRVVWNSPQDKDDFQTKENLAQREPSVDSDRKDQSHQVHPSQSSNSSNSSSAQINYQATTSAPSEREVNTTPEERSSPSSPPIPSSNAISSDHQAYIKCIDSKQIEEIDKNLVAQSKGETNSLKSINDFDCDTSFISTPPKTCETDQKQCLQHLQTNFSPNQKREHHLHDVLNISGTLNHEVRQTDDEDCRENMHSGSHRCENHQRDSCDDVDVSQSITDTLSECVNNVDIEVRQQVIASTEESLKIEMPERKNRVKHHENSQIFTKKNDITSVGDIEGDIKTEVTNTKVTQSIKHIHKLTEDCKKNDCEASSVKVRGSKEDPTVEKIGESPLDIPEAQISENTSDKEARKRKLVNAELRDTNKRSRKSSSSIERKDSRKSLSNKTTENPTNCSRDSTMMTLKSPSVNSPYIRQKKIFAKWTDHHYYPGTILKSARDRKFVISFFDGAQKNIAENDLIPLENIVGRQVRVSIAKNLCANAHVYGQRSPVNEQPMFDVEYQQDGLVRKCVPLRDIFLTSEQGNVLINQVDRSSGASNFADVDLDNIIYEKRSRRLQENEDFELFENNNSANNTGTKRKRGQYHTRNMNNLKTMKQNSNIDDPDGTNHNINTSHLHQKTRNNQHSDSNLNRETEDIDGSDVLKTNLCPNSNPPSESSSSTGSSNVPTIIDLGQEFYFASSPPHRTKTSLLL